MTIKLWKIHFREMDTRTVAAESIQGALALIEYRQGQNWRKQKWTDKEEMLYNYEITKIEMIAEEDE